MTNRHCRYCSRDLHEARNGRPRDYCSVGCRRAAEYEIRRISRRLEELEGLAHRLELWTAEYALPNAGIHDWQRQKHASQVQTVSLQIARARERMRELLDDDPVVGMQGDSLKLGTSD